MVVLQEMLCMIYVYKIVFMKMLKDLRFHEQ